MARRCTVVGEISLSGNSLLRVSVVHHGNRRSLDIRRWYEDEHGRKRPTKKGVQFSISKVRGLAQLIRKARKRVGAESA